jgi:2'-5' RNA ligase
MQRVCHNCEPTKHFQFCVRVRRAERPLSDLMAKKTIRAFIAIHLPDDVKKYLGNLTDELAEAVPRRSVRWVQPDRMHLTLRFLGDTDLALLPELQRALDATAAQYRQFGLQLHGFGCFPNCRRPRVLWVGVDGELKQAEDRPFRPHLTLGRVNDARPLASQKWPTTVEALAIPVQAIHLIESELTPDGPIYTMRHSSALQPT